MKSLLALSALCASVVAARADWSAERCYPMLTNLVTVGNPGVPLKNFRVVTPAGALGPVLTNRAAVTPLLHPGDFLRVKSTLSSIGATGPRNPHVVMEIPTGNQN